MVGVTLVEVGLGRDWVHGDGCPRMVAGGGIVAGMHRLHLRVEIGDWYAYGWVWVEQSRVKGLGGWKW